MSKKTSVRSFGGANIKGNPSMPGPAVTNDVKILKRRLDIVALQEFQWKWYWRIAGILLDKNWDSYPSFQRGLLNPIKGAQGILWKTKINKRISSRSKPAFNFEMDHGGIMDNRWIRAVLLQDRATHLSCWYISTHFVVGADAAGDSPRRKNFLIQNLRALDEMLDYCSRTGEAIVLELDANIHANSWAHRELMEIIERHGGRVVGEHGVEYMAVFNGPHTRIVVDKHYVLAPKQAGLKTDHEVRCMDHHLESTN